MSKKAFSLDWLKCTFVWDGKSNPIEVSPLTSDSYENTSGEGNYNEGVTCETHSLSWHTERPEQKVMLQMTGVQLDEFRKQGGEEKDVISMCVERRANFTRVDFAVDLFDTDGIPTDLIYAWECNQLDTIAKTVGFVEKRTRSASKGQTVYVGSRTSERMARVYEKGKQKGLKLDWIRVELEAKGKRANQLGYLISTRGTKNAGLSMLLDLIEWSDIEWLNGVWSDDFDVIDINSIGRPETDRDRWLRTVVIPVVDRELESGNNWLLSALVTLIEEHELRSQHGPSLSPSP